MKPLYLATERFAQTENESTILAVLAVVAQPIGENKSLPGKSYAGASVGEVSPLKRTVS
jgi:hypothetical protein